MRTQFYKNMMLPPPIGRRPLCGLTIPEMMVAMAVFSLAIGGAIYTHLFGLRQDQIAQSKLGASDQSRRGFGVMCRDIRMAKGWSIGNGNGSTFTPIAINTAQQGNAVRLYPTTTNNFIINSNIFVIYYFDTAQGELRRRTNNSAFTRIATDLTNNMFFRAEDYRGNTLTVPIYRANVHTFMEVAQYQYPLTKVGKGYYYDYYKMEFRVTSHAPDGP